jgi:hypothetical protein
MGDDVISFSSPYWSMLKLLGLVICKQYLLEKSLYIVPSKNLQLNFIQCVPLICN